MLWILPATWSAEPENELWWMNMTSTKSDSLYFYCQVDMAECLIKKKKSNNEKVFLLIRISELFKLCNLECGVVIKTFGTVLFYF